MQTYFRRLSLQDAVNLAFESGEGSMEVGAFIYLDAGPLLDAAGGLRLEDLRNLVGRRLPAAPELLERVHFPGPLAGRPVWVDDGGFDIERHVLAAPVPAPRTEAAALETVSRLMRDRLSLRHPPWQIWFLTRISDGRLGMLIKLHHVLADGTATINLTRCLLDLTRLPAPARFAPWRPRRIPGYLELLLDNLATKALVLARAGVRLLHPRRLYRAQRAHFSSLRTTLGAGHRAPGLSINRLVSGDRCFRVARYRLEEVRAVAHAHGAKVNDVLLDLVAGGVGALLAARGEPIAGVELHASVAVSLRAEGDIGRSGNQVGNVIVPVPLDLEPVRRLELIAAASRRARAEQGGAPAISFLVLLAELGLTRFLTRHQHLINVLVSNLAGPPIPLFLMGAQALDGIALTPIAGNVGLGFAALSYAGAFNVSVVADSRLAGDLELVLAGMRHCWDQLRHPPISPSEDRRAALPIGA